MQTTLTLPTLDELRNHVLDVLCQYDNLDPNQTPLTAAAITRRKRVCGMFFQAHGPRLLRTYAVWTDDENRILFYDCNGSRFAESRLSESPEPILSQ